MVAVLYVLLVALVVAGAFLGHFITRLIDDWSRRDDEDTDARLQALLTAQRIHHVAAEGRRRMFEEAAQHRRQHR